ncbi:hypothetical protein [Celeribacter neptunius]|uniref:Uncharacterized protein n=1 Tax=Celeribacter neptunius TaxID=588602 RepID=A0A1I3P7E1_9RHOB|nr:hypothetical protein [Celeribacter neptunius]SFJ17257.1 hypothetical protein SAMN04487991_1583 [Celeribacter neptunius]
MRRFRVTRFGVILGLALCGSAAGAEFTAQNPEFMRNGAAVCIGAYTVAQYAPGSGSQISYWQGILHQYREALSEAEIQALVDERVAKFENIARRASFAEGAAPAQKAAADFIRNATGNCAGNRALLEKLQ